MPHSKADWLEDPEYMAELRKSLMHIAVGKMPRVSDAEEVVQRTLQALIESRGRVLLQTTPLQYAIGILKNKVRDHYRALRQPPTEELDETLGVAETPEDYVNVEELREAIRRSIARMSDECRRIFRPSLSGTNGIGDPGKAQGSEHRCTEDAHQPVSSGVEKATGRQDRIWREVAET